MSFQRHVNRFERAQVFRPDSTASNNIQHWEMMSLLSVTEATRKKTQILPARVWPMTLWFLVQMLYHWAIGVLGVSCQVLRPLKYRFMGLTCEQALRGALAARRKKEGELTTASLRKRARIQTNIEKHVKARAKGNDVIANFIYANQHFASTFSMQIFKFQRRSCKLSFLFPPRRQSAQESLVAGYTWQTSGILLGLAGRWVAS